jgi:hypothetical protein
MAVKMQEKREVLDEKTSKVEILRRLATFSGG